MASSSSIAPQIERREQYERTSSEAHRIVESVLAGGQARLDAELNRLRTLGVIDENGKRIRTDLPPDMMPGADRDFGG